MSNTISQTGSSAGSAGKYTPTPWRTWETIQDVYPPPHRDDRRIVGSNDICVGIIFGGWEHTLPECDANAAFIVKAVNAHDDLVAALKFARDLVEAERDLRGDHDETYEYKATETLSVIDAALAKATGASS